MGGTRRVGGLAVEPIPSIPRCRARIVPLVTLTITIAITLVVAACGSVPATPMSALPLPAPVVQRPTPTGTVTGSIVWPEWLAVDGTATVDLCFEDLPVGRISTVPVNTTDASFEVQLPEGQYRVHVWLPGFTVKGTYAPVGQDGLSATRVPVPFSVTAGSRTTGIEISCWVRAKQPPLALCGRLLDGTGADALADGVLIIQEGRIVAVGSRSDVGIPEEATVVDLPGSTILPGLINAHVHNAFNTEYLRQWAQAGVTTVRDVGAPVQFPAFTTRDRLNADPQNARIIAAGPLVTVPGGYPIVPNNFPSLTVSSPADAAGKIADLIDRGADLVKITITPEGNLPTLTATEVKAIVDAAHGKGVVVSAHVTSAAAMARAADAGVDDMAHAATDSLSDRLIEQMVSQGTTWVPTISALGGRGIDNLRRFVTAGGRIALGNDSGYLEGLDLGLPMDEIRWLYQAGVTPLGVILAATRDAAYVCRLDGLLGTLELGKVADVLVVRGDPLADLGTLNKVVMVLHGGTVIRD